jgi:hypothetical protein
LHTLRQSQPCNCMNGASAVVWPLCLPVINAAWTGPQPPAHATGYARAALWRGDWHG